MFHLSRLITSSARRFLKLGGLAGRVGASVAGDQVLNLIRSGPNKQVRQTENLVRNATRIVETLGEMKGAAMKVGQMLSLHEGLLPPEVAAVLRALQREAPRVPSEVMEFEIRGALENYDDLFESVIKQNAPQLQTVLKAEFISSGIIRTGGGDQADDRVDVLVVFDQLTTNKQLSEEQRSPAYAVVTMVNEDGDWLVDDVKGPKTPQ